MRSQRVLDRISSAVGGYVRGRARPGDASPASLSLHRADRSSACPTRAALALIIFLLDLVPLVGATLGAIIVGIVTLFNDFPTDTIIWVVWSIVYQQVENTVIQPRIQARAVNVQPIVVLIAVLFGSTLFGSSARCSRSRSPPRSRSRCARCGGCAAPRWCPAPTR